MKVLLKWSLLAFALGLGGAVAYRMSAEAMAVVVGVVCGVLSSVLVSGLMWALARSWTGRAQPGGAAPRRSDYPPVVVIQPGVPARGMLGSGDSYGYYGAGWEPEASYLPAPAGGRDFNVVGEDDWRWE